LLKHLKKRTCSALSSEQSATPKRVKSSSTSKEKTKTKGNIVKKLKNKIQENPEKILENNVALLLQNSAISKSVSQ
jgi:hypothetical protein